MKKQKRSIISGILVLSLSLGMGFNVSATTVDEAKKKGEQLESQKKSAEAEKSSLAAQLNAVITEMNISKEKLQKKQEEIQIAEDELVQAKVAENDQYESMKKRIKYMYEAGNSQMIEILVSSEDIGDFLNKAEYVSELSTYDRGKLAEFQDTVRDVEAKEATLQAEYTELTALQDQLMAQQGEVETLLSNKQVEISSLESQIGENAAVLQQLIEQAEAERQKQIQAQAAAEAAAEAARKAAQEAASAGNSGGSGGYVPPSSPPVVSGNGQFTHPCPAASVSSTFGYRTFDNSFHNGLDLAAPEGTPTYAAADGTVIIAGWSDSAGNWVVINHGNGLTTKSMHHSALTVSAGQSVVKGQQIGLVGNTGNSFGAHLHFQVESNGSPVDPQGYL